MAMNRRLLLKTAAVGLPVAVVSGVVSRSVGSSGRAPAVPAAVEEPACQPGAGRVIFWGEQHNTDEPSSTHPPYASLLPPVPKELQSGVTAVAAAGSYIFGLKGGRVYGFGYCGCNSNDWNGERPWNIPPAATAGVTALSAGISNVLALRDGQVIGWGANSGLSAVPDAAKSGVTAISCSSFGLAVKNGGVIQWGSTTLPAVPDAAKSGVVAVSAGSHALALREDGSVVAWGEASLGAAIQVPEAARSGVTAIAAGSGTLGHGSFSLALKDGKVFGWGSNDLGQLSAPQDTDVIAIEAGSHNGMSLTKRGTVNVWGLPNQSQTEIPDEICKTSAISISAYMCAALI